MTVAPASAPAAPPAPPARVAVLGAGTWGLALMKILHENGHAVRMWDFFPAVIERLGTREPNRRLGGLCVPESVSLHADLGEALRGAELAVVVVPSTAVRSTIRAALDSREAGVVAAWVLCSKGIEPGTRKLLHEVAAEELGPGGDRRVVVLTGPSHAEEVALGLPTSIVAASLDPEAAGRVQRLFFQPRFRVYTHDDVLGAELGGAIKNVIAIAAGVSDGLGFGDNTRAALITRSLVEIIRLGVAMGARMETFIGLSGLGDLIVTATSRHSRNHQFGELLASGKSCVEALAEIGMVVEGYNTVAAARDLGREHGVEMPIAEAVHRLIFEGLPAREALMSLLGREAKPEGIPSAARSGPGA